MVMELSKFLTIIIPCKNEKKIVSKCLDLLNYQNGVKNVKVIVSDSSDDDETKDNLFKRKKDKFKLKIIDGGLPSVARNKGVKYVDTPYILFLDSDVFLLDEELLIDMINFMVDEDLDLSTCKFTSTNGRFNRVFNFLFGFQKLTKYISPFALGGFMMIKTDKFKEVGGFDEEVKIAEDYQLSRKISFNKFKLFNKVVFTTPRRFENKGISYMMMIFIMSYLKRNNKKYFTNDKNYWK